MDDSLIKDLQALGLNAYEAKVYLALLERPSLDTAEVSKISGVPRGRVYDVLDDLVKKGMASYKPGKTKKYSALDIVEIAEERGKQIEIITRKLKEKQELIQAHKANGNPLEYMQVLKNHVQIQRKVVQLCSETTKEMRAFVKPPFYYTTQKHRDEQIKVQLDAVKRGVKTRSILEIPNGEAERVRFFEEIYDNISWKNSGETRVMERLPMKLLIFDENIVMFSLEDPIQGTNSITSLVTEHPALAEGFKALFESYWREAKDYYILNKRKHYLS
jgi:HTH-type transcriptional regulator, sugar sensing transcriptional regulator